MSAHLIALAAPGKLLNALLPVGRRSFLRNSPVARLSALALVAAFALALALLASPRMHSFVHAKATESNHVCFVSTLQTGGCDSAVPPTLTAAPVRSVSVGVSVAATEQVPPLFLSCALLEHAPPLAA